MSAPGPTDCLLCGLTPQQIIEGMGELAQAGLSALGQPLLAQLVPFAEKLAEDAAALIEGPTATEVLTTEVDTEQAAAVAAGKAKFSGGTPE